jgi:hypothetical protein
MKMSSCVEWNKVSGMETEITNTYEPAACRAWRPGIVYACFKDLARKMRKGLSECS